MLNVLISSPSFDVNKNVSGVSKVVYELTGALHGKIEFGHVLLGSQTGPNGKIAFRSRFTALAGAWKIFSSRAEIYHSNTALNLKSVIRDMALCLVAKCSGKKVLLHTHGGYYLDRAPGALIKLLVNSLFSLSTQIVALSETELRLLREFYKIDSTKSEFVYNFVRKSENVAGTLRLEGEPLRVAFIGRLVPVKGIDRYLAVAQTVPADAACFRVYGDGELRGLIEENAAKGVIEYLGVFGINEAPRVMSSIDVLLLLSESGEGMPMVVLEAMNSGVIPIVTKLGSLEEVVDHGENGFIVSDNAVAETSELLLSLSHAPKKVKAMSDKARETAVGKFGEEASSNKMFDIYAKLCAA